MNVIVVGLSHKTAPVDVREKITFPADGIKDPLEAVKALPACYESMILSTCNRVEIYAAVKDADAAAAGIKQYISDSKKLPLSKFSEHMYLYEGEEAIKHAFRVASSLDSMIVGEPQILGQIKDAYGYASEFKTAGLILNKLMHKAFSVAKKVRTETKIASSAVSISFAAVELGRKIFGDLDGKVAMIIGAGEMCELAARHLIGNGVSKVYVTNRTFERAENLAKEFEGEAIKFDEFYDHLHKVDIIVSSTGAPHHVIEHKKMQSVIKERRNKPMFLIDIAVPRDIDPKINDIDNVYVYNIDDLNTVVQSNMKGRRKEAIKAEHIVNHEIGNFYSWIKNLNIVPTIIAIRKRFEDIRQSELNKTLSSLNGSISKEGEKALDAMTNAIINKILHNPITMLKKANREDDMDSELYIDALMEMFELKEYMESKESNEDTNDRD
ncbi:glutamyl-tRNA reductase [Thermodesulfobacteriota bacterium]